MKNKFFGRLLTLCAAAVMSITFATAAMAEGEVYVAQVGETKYTTLQEAVNFIAATDSKSGTITLMDNVVVSGSDVIVIGSNTTIILDMARHSITVDENYTGGRPIKNEGNLTVTGNGTIDSTAAGENGWGAIRNDGGTLRIVNGTFAGTVQADASAIRNAGKCTIENGDFTGTAAVYNAPEGNLTILNGYFHSTSCSTKDGECGKYAYTINSHGELLIENCTVTGVQGALAVGGGHAVINGGTYETVACKTHGEGPAHYAVYIAGETSGATAEIYGGTYQAISKSAIWVGNDNTNGDGGINAKATVKVYGGKYSSQENVPVMMTGPVTGTPAIYGGYFSNNSVARQNATSETLDSYLADGSQIVRNEGWFVIHNHALNLEEKAEKAATCTEDGNKAYWN